MPKVIAPKNYSDEFDVRAYGAKGDGSTDDTAAIQKALDAVGDAGGGVVHIPKGVYLISDTLLCPDYTVLRGVGDRTILLADPDVPDTFFMVRTGGVTDLTIRDIMFDGNDHPSVLGVLVGLYSTFNRFLIEGCTFEGMTAYSVRTFGTQLTDYTVRNCIFQNSSAGGVSLEATDGTVSTRFMFQNNVWRDFIDFYQPLIQFQGPDDTFDNWQRIVIEGNLVENMPGQHTPFEVTNGSDVSVTGNVVQGGRNAVSAGRCLNLSVTGNVFKEVEGYAIELGISTGVVISGNMVRKCSSFVWATNSTFANCVTDVTIVGNTIIDSGYLATGGATAMDASILCQNGARRWTIQGNRWTNVKQNGTSDASVIKTAAGGMGDPTANIVIRDNDYAITTPTPGGATTTFINVASSGTLVFSNNVVQTGSTFIR